jgi:allantoinase
VAPSVSAVSEPFDVVIIAPRAILPDGEQPCAIAVAGERIAAVQALPHGLAARRTVELGDDVVVLPGIVDSHVHICEPGNTDWEGFATATAAAAAGGITTLVDMPLDSIPTTTDVAALDAKRAAADGQCHVDVGFWGGVVPGNLGELAGVRDSGGLGFKCFLVDSGSEEFPPVSAAEMEEAMAVIAQLGAPLLVHAESQEVAAGLPVVHTARYEEYLRSRPRGLENLAVAQVIEAARRTGGRAHVCHVSSSDAVPMIRSAQADGLAVTGETCPHYLALCAEDVADGRTSVKCSPPVRERANRELLWAALRDGVLEAVVSDHSPCAADMKRTEGGDFATAWGGITSLQVSLPVVWTEADARGFSLGDIARWMAAGPARLAGLESKGSIEAGKDADLCVLAPDEEFTVDPAQLHHRHPGTPYDGRTLRGVVRQTWLRGQPVDLAEPRGQLLRAGGTS